jgi:hypothetical protein
VIGWLIGIGTSTAFNIPLGWRRVRACLILSQRLHRFRRAQRMRDENSSALKLTLPSAEGPIPDQTLVLTGLKPILSLMASHRRILITVYLVVLATFAAGFVFTGNSLFGEPRSWSFLPVSDMLECFLILLAFLALQALFLWGGGRIRLKMKPVRFRKIGISYIIFAVLMLIVTFGTCASFWGMATILQPSAPFVPQPFLASLALVLAGWLCWLVVGWLALKHVDKPTALSHLIVIILGGSWVEFAAAFPIELSTRSHAEDCPCAVPSFFALITCIPILV